MDGDCDTPAAVKSYMVDGNASQSGYFFYKQGGSGKEITYNLLYTTINSSLGRQFSYYASSVKYAGGETHDLEYDIAQYPGPQNVTLNARRPVKVKSNRGFELRIQYASADPYSTGWSTPVAAAIYRRGEYTSPLSSITYTNSQSVTDQAGNLWLGTFNNSLGSKVEVAEGVYRPPTNNTDQISATSAAYDRRGNLLTSLTKGSQIWNYTYSQGQTVGTAPSVGARDVTITGPAGYYRKVFIGEAIGSYAQIKKEVDGLNRTTNYTYAGPRMTGITFPEGNQVRLTYDLIGNIIKKENISKAGSGLATLTESAGFPAGNCATEGHGAEIQCYRPLWVKDAKGNQTDYTWDPQNGEMLSEIKPADANGVRPMRRIEYVERFAWYNNGSGTFIRSPTGILLKSRERSCKTSATISSACAAGATDEFVTDYDYGPDSGPNYLLLRGITVTATGSSGALETLRTCFTYDPQGRKISETQPLGTGSTCP